MCISYLRAALNFSVVLRELLKGVLWAKFTEGKTQLCKVHGGASSCSSGIGTHHGQQQGGAKGLTPLEGNPWK